jgi:hypothetical protein
VAAISDRRRNQSRSYAAARNLKCDTGKQASRLSWQTASGLSNSRDDCLPGF